MTDSSGRHHGGPPIISSPDATLVDATAEAPEPLVLSPLNGVHVAAGAAFTDFAGWQMPVRYSSDLAEHHAVRTSAGIFDLSHMAEIRVAGPEAAAFLDYALAGKLSAIAIGQAKYSLLLTPSAGIVDDLVVYRRDEADYLVVANAGNHYQALDALVERAAGFDATVVDESDDTALIAVQGPNARRILQAAAGIHFGALGDVPSEPAVPGPPAVQGSTPDAHPLDSLKYYWSVDASYAGEPLFVARTGYTGEDGFELYVPAPLATALWKDLVAAGEPFALVPAGLASRDTLRLEAGMPLYGHELGLDTLPAAAGLGRVPNLGKGEFVGRAALEAAAERGDEPARVLVGLVGEGKRAARAEYEIFAAEPTASGTTGSTATDSTATDTTATDTTATGSTATDAPIGVVTSGVLSPTLGHPVAMAYVDRAHAEPGTALTIDIRGKRLAFRVTDLPFYRRKRD